MGNGNAAANGGDSVTFEVLQKVASAEGCDVTELPPLHRTIDPEAFEEVAGSENVRLEFEYCGYVIVVEDGTITVRE